MDLHLMILEELKSIKSRLNDIENGKKFNENTNNDSWEGDIRQGANNRSQHNCIKENVALSRTNTKPRVPLLPLPINPKETYDLSQLIYRSCQLRHHSNNWQHLPTSIANKLDQIFENIVPPAPNEDLKTKLANMNNNLKSQLVATLLQHIHDQQDAVNTKLANSNPNREQFDQAAATARDKLKNHFKQKIRITDINNWIKEDLDLTENKTEKITENKTEKITVTEKSKQPSKNPKRTIDAIKSPISTNNRFEVLEIEEIDNITEYPSPPAKQPTPKKKKSCDELTLIQVHQQKPTDDLTLEPPISDKSSPTRNPIQFEQANFNIAMDEIIFNENEEIGESIIPDTQVSEEKMNPKRTLSTAPNKSAKANYGKFTEHRCSPKNAWSVSVADNTTTLIIGDSNMRKIQNIPEDWEAHVFPGAYLSHASNIINKLPEFNNLRTIIVAVGINNRAW